MALNNPEHPKLNNIYRVNEFRVCVHALLQDGTFYVFHASNGGYLNKPTISCHIYDTPCLNFTGYVNVYTKPTDGYTWYGQDQFPIGRSHASGSTLEECVANLDWPHRPSELNMLRQILFYECKDTQFGRTVAELFE